MTQARLSAPLVLEYPFTRTTGPVVGAFLTGLRERVISGIRRADGSVLVPPTEYDPLTAEALSELVPVSDTGTVVSWTWSAQRRPQAPWHGPVALALILLDGADTPLLHAVLVDGPAAISTGLRVRAVWREERAGHITDLVGFEPAADEPAEPVEPRALDAALADVERVRSVRTPIRMEYTYTPGRAAQEYLRAFADRRILGQRSPVDGAVFVPPRGVDPRHGTPGAEMVELAHCGHVGSFCVTRVPIPGRDDLNLPYVSAWIFLDGADVGFLGLVGECDPAEARIGMRVEAVWKDDAEIGPTAESIRWWRPTGEPDIPFAAAGVRRWRNRT